MKGAKRMRLKFGDFTIEVYQAPAADTPKPKPDRVAAAVVAALGAAGRRLTTTKLLAALAERGCEFSERTVKGRLAEMVADGRLTADSGPASDGYGLPEWAD